MAFEPAATALPEPRLLLERAAAVDADGAVAKLNALLCVDAARWLAWPEALPAADPLESRLLGSAVAWAQGDSAAADVLRRDLNARVAVAAASPDHGVEGAVARLAELPAGYAVKSTWLRWRQLLLTCGRRDQYEALRRRLAEQCQHTVPPSETLPVLLGRLALTRRRAEHRLAQEACQRLAPLLTPAGGAGFDDVQRGFQASAGRWLLRLGDELAGGQLLYRASDGLRPAEPVLAGQLFSKPAPPAALWLRQGLDRTVTASSAARDTLLHHTVGALLDLATRYRLPHLLRETLEPLTVRFARPDLTALVLTSGAVAWLSCGERWQGAEWLGEGLRVALRQCKAPLAVEAGLAVGGWVARTGDARALTGLRELAGRVVGSGKLALDLELARLESLRSPGGAGGLNALYPQVLARLQQGDVEPLRQYAGALLGCGQRASGLRLARAALDPSTSVPPVPGGGDVEQEEAAWQERLAQPLQVETAAPLVRVLLEGRETALARELLHAAASAVMSQREVNANRRGALVLVRRAAEGLDLELAAALDAAVADEALRVRERLRVDDWPGG